MDFILLNYFFVWEANGDANEKKCAQQEGVDEAVGVDHGSKENSVIVIDDNSDDNGNWKYWIFRMCIGAR